MRAILLALLLLLPLPSIAADGDVIYATNRGQWRMTAIYACEARAAGGSLTCVSAFDTQNADFGTPDYLTLAVVDDLDNACSANPVVKLFDSVNPTSDQFFYASTSLGGGPPPRMSVPPLRYLHATVDDLTGCTDLNVAIVFHWRSGT